MTKHFFETFRGEGGPAARGKYLSRVFDIFVGELVRIWADDPRGPYEDLGRAQSAAGDIRSLTTYRPC